MGGKQSGHNDISPTKLNSIHHKVVINTNRVERIDSTDYNTICNCEMSVDGDGDGGDVGDYVDDDLDDARDDDDDDDGDDLHPHSSHNCKLCCNPYYLSSLL